MQSTLFANPELFTVARPKTKPRVLQPQPTLRLKILVVGETRCGKTSLVHAYLHNNAMGTDPDGETNWTPLFGPTSLQFEKTNYVPTIGVDYYAAAVPTSRVIPASASTPGCIARVHTSFIDLSGDLAYVKVRSEFYSDWNVILFCFDCTKRETFTQLESWVAEADKFNPNANQQKGQLKVVVACKCDYAHSGPGFTREVPTAEAKAWAEAKGMHYVETSAWLAMSDEVPLSKRQNTAKILDGVFANASGELKLPAGFTQADQPSSASSASSGAHNASESKFASQQSGYSSSSTSNNTSSTSSGSGGLPHPSSMSVHALMAELTERGVPRSEWGLEKSEMVEALLKARQQTSGSGKAQNSESTAFSASSSSSSAFTRRASTSAPTPSAPESAVERESGLPEAVIQRIRSELESWAKGKDIRSMLNSLHSASSGDSLYLAADADLTQVSKVYKRALLKIHPDKQDPSDRAAMYRATELFKIVNTAFESFKTAEERRSSVSVATTSASASNTAASTHKFTSTHTPHYGQPTGNRRRR